MEERNGQGIAYPTLEELTKTRTDTDKALTEAIQKNRILVDNLFRIAQNQRLKINTLTRRLNAAGEILLGLGYSSNMDFSVWSHKTLHKCPGCGGMPIIQRFQYDKHGWIVICSECSHRTEEQLTPIHAVKAWNEGKYTYMSELTQNNPDGTPRKRRKRHDEDDT